MKHERETVFDVDGMSCPSCIRHIDHALMKLDGVSTVDVRLREGKVHVRHDQQATSLASLLAALEEAGYPSREAR